MNKDNEWYANSFADDSSLVALVVAVHVVAMTSGIT